MNFCALKYEYRIKLPFWYLYNFPILCIVYYVGDETHIRFYGLLRCCACLYTADDQVYPDSPTSPAAHDFRAQASLERMLLISVDITTT